MKTDVKDVQLIYSDLASNTSEVGEKPAPRIKGIRFLRSVSFPRFSMRAGEFWQNGFDPVGGLGKTGREYFAAVESGDDRFAFAGGHCFVKDVEPVWQTDEDIEQERYVAAMLRSLP